MEIAKEPERDEDDFGEVGQFKLSKCAKFHTVCSCESIITSLLIFIIAMMNFVAFILFEAFDEKWSFFAVAIFCLFPLFYFPLQILLIVCNDVDKQKKKENKQTFKAFQNPLYGEPAERNPSLPPAKNKESRMQTLKKNFKRYVHQFY
jgi:hypothetical protein